MKKPVVLGIAVFLTILVLLLVFGCSKSVTPPQVSVNNGVAAPAPVLMAPAIQPAVVVAPTPVVTPAVTPVLVVAKAPKKAHKRSGMSKAERDAYAKAYRNAKLANHLLGRAKYRTHFHNVG